MANPAARPSKAKRRILTAAARLFRERGFARATVRDLADVVGILSGSLFHHFKSKDEILFAVMEEVIADMNVALDQALEQAQTTKDRVHALIRVQLQFVHGDNADATAVLVYEWNALSDEGRARLLANRKAYFDRWQEVLEQAHAEGLTPVAPTVLRQLIHGAIVWTANWYRRDGPMSLEELETSVIALVLK